MKKWEVVIHLNNNAGTEYISECGQYTIDDSRKEITWQQGMPVMAVSFKGIPEDVRWKVKK